MGGYDLFRGTCNCVGLGWEPGGETQICGICCSLIQKNQIYCSTSLAMDNSAITEAMCPDFEDDSYG